MNKKHVLEPVNLPLICFVFDNFLNPFKTDPIDVQILFNLALEVFLVLEVFFMISRSNYTNFKI